MSIISSQTLGSLKSQVTGPRRSQDRAAQITPEELTIERQDFIAMDVDKNDKVSLSEIKAFAPEVVTH